MAARVRDSDAPVALVLDAGARAAVETIQSLGRLGWTVHVSGADDALGFASRYADERFIQPKAEGPGLRRFLEDLDREHRYDLIVPATEISLSAFLDLEESAPLYRKAQLPPQRSLRVALDKESTLAAASAVGIRVPQTAVLRSLGGPAAGAFPRVLKPRTSRVMVDGRWTTLHPALVHNEEERQLELEELLPATPVLEQEVLSGVGWGIECLYERGVMRWHFCHRRLHEGSGRGGLGSGSAYRRAAPAPPPMLEDARRLLDALAWHGVAMVEFKVAPDGSYALMEINPRLWGSLALAIDAGVDFPAGLACLALAQELSPQPRYSTRYRTRLMPEDLSWIRHHILAERSIASVGEAVGILRVLLPGESWDFLDWGDLGPLREELLQGFDRARDRVREKKFNAEMAKRARARHEANVVRYQRRQQPIRSILFVCLGNICRSPVAAALARQSFPGVEATSAGFIELDGRTSPAKIEFALANDGVSVRSHRSRHLDVALVERADVIVLLDANNYRKFEELFPRHVSKVLQLGMFLPRPAVDIADPIAMDLGGTKDVVALIRSAVGRLGEVLALPRSPDGRPGDGR